MVYFTKKLNNTKQYEYNGNETNNCLDTGNLIKQAEVTADR